MTTHLSEKRLIAFHVLAAFSDDRGRFAITCGKFNFALTEVDTGAILRTFIPDTDKVEDVMRALNAPHPSVPYRPDTDVDAYVSFDAQFEARS